MFSQVSVSHLWMLLYEFGQIASYFRFNHLLSPNTLTSHDSPLSKPSHYCWSTSQTGCCHLFDFSISNNDCDDLNKVSLEKLTGKRKEGNIENKENRRKIFDRYTVNKGYKMMSIRKDNVSPKLSLFAYPKHAPHLPRLLTRSWHLLLANIPLIVLSTFHDFPLFLRLS